MHELSSGAGRKLQFFDREELFKLSIFLVNFPQNRGFTATNFASLDKRFPESRFSDTDI